MTPIRTPRLRRSLRRSPLLVAATAFLVVLAACGAPAKTPSASDASPHPGGDLTVGITDYCGAFDKQQTSGCTFANIDITDNLVDQDPKTGKIIPWLAKSWDVEKNGARYVFHLRDDVTFSNGEKFDAQVVKDNFDGIIKLAKQGKSFQAGAYLLGYTGSDVIDDDTVAVNFSAPKAGILQAFSEKPLGIVAPATLKLTADQRAAQGVIGSGPFVLKQLVPHQKIVLARRDDYKWPSARFQHQGPAYLKTLTFLIVPEDSVRTGSLVSKQLDSIGYVQSQDVDQILNSGAKIEARASSGVVYNLRPNYDNPILKQLAVRQAIQHAINRQEIHDTVFNQYNPEATGIVSSIFPGYLKQTDALSYDPDAVTKTLTGAGWAKGADGVWAKDGKRLSIVGEFSDSGDKPVFELVQQELAANGIELKIKQATAAQLAADQASGNWGLLYGNLTRPDPDVFLSSFSPAFSTYNKTDIDPGLTKLINQQAVELDAKKRLGLSQEIQKRIVDEGLAFPITETTQTLASNPDVHGIGFTAPWWPSFVDVWKS